jgi:hypothetical protein
VEDVSFQGAMLLVTLRSEAGMPLLAQLSSHSTESEVRSGQRFWAVWDPTAAHRLPPAPPAAG